MPNAISLINSSKSGATEVDIKGSKSFTNRALILAAQAQGKSTLLNPSESDDTKALIESLKCFGVEFESHSQALVVNRTSEDLTPYKGTIDVGPAGTTMRFLTAFISSVHGAEVTLQGSERMHKRPISDLVDAMTAQGSSIEYLGKQGCPPLKINGRHKQTRYAFEVNSEVSSQYLSAILLSAPSLASYVEIIVDGELASSSYINMTLDAMRKFEVNVINEGLHYFNVSHSQPEAVEYIIEGDATGAGYFWALAAATGRKIRTRYLTVNSTQGDIMLLRILEEMGCVVKYGNDNGIDWIEVDGAKELQPVECDLTMLPDSAQTLAVLCALAKGESKLKGLSTLKKKECDRLEALKTELAKLGVKTETTDDSITIVGGTLSVPGDGLTIDTYDDHRMAMSFAILAGVTNGININEPQVVSKSFPNFWELLSSCGIHSS